MNIMFTPWTIDTYSTFTTDSFETMEIDNYNEVNGTNYNYDDFEWSYDHKGIVKALAKNWLEFVTDNIIDDVIVAIKPDGEPWSPREYNFSTDNQNIIFTVNYDKLNDYIKANQASYNKNKIASCDGFMWFGDDDQTKLHYYLAYKSGNDYTPANYQMDQYEREFDSSWEYITYELIKKNS